MNDDDYNDMIDDYINDQLDEDEYREMMNDFEEADEMMATSNEQPPSNAVNGGGGQQLNGTIQSTSTSTTSVFEPTTTAARQQQASDTFGQSSLEDQSDDESVGIAIKTNNIYSFERYNKQTCWRSEGASNDMNAKEWKSRSSPKNKQENSGVLMSAFLTSQKYRNDKRKCRAIASDSHLLKFQPLWYNHRQLDIHAKTVSHHPLPGKKCVPMTLGDGSRIYVSESIMNDDINNKEVVSSQAGSTSSILLGVSMDVLMNRVNTVRRRKEHEHILQQQQSDGHDESFMNEDYEVDNDESNHDTLRSKLFHDTTTTSPTSVTASNVEYSNTKIATRNRRNMSKEYQLWVDKHAPKSFAHLLSDERSNREVVRALRSWDPYVFHRDAPPPPTSMNGGYYSTNNNNNNSTYNSNNMKNNTSSNQVETGGKTKTRKNKDRRPDENSRVILLSGPPGVGKTTLAHIVAHHCGYRPIEVNGSDERSEASLLDRVIRGMESTTLDNMFETTSNDNKGRPNCLILDEIDGIDTKGTMQALVDIIRADIPAKGANAKNVIPFLRRPIILICNNKYAPALKPLLPYCKYQFTVYPPQTARLVARLRSVLAAENLSLHSGSTLLLNQLVASSCGDIRSCLYTLQFAAVASCNASRKKSSTTTTDISKALTNSLQGNGLKDERHDVSGIVTSIFRKEKEVHTFAKSSKTMFVPNNTTRSSVDRVLDMVKSFGEYSRILDCIFLNVMNVSYIDPTLDRCAAVHEWLSSADVCRGNKSNAIDFAVEALQITTAAAAVHMFCRVEHQRQQQLTFTTRELSDTRYQLESNRSIVQKFVDGFSAQSNIGRDIDSISVHTIPYVLWILSAGEGNRSLSRAATTIELLSSGERESFVSHASALSTLGLKYVVDHEHDENDSDRIISGGFGKTSHGIAVKMRLEPPIEKFIHYTQLQHMVERREVPPAMKELLSRQAVHEKLCDEAGRRKSKLEIANKLKSSKSTIDEGNITSATTMPRTLDEEKASPPTVLTEKRKVRDEETDNATPHDETLAQSTLSATTKDPSPKKPVVVVTEQPAPYNFLSVGAKRAKLVRSARTAARVRPITSIGDITTAATISHTGSGVPLRNVIRLKFVKGFTQAVRTPCQIEDLV